MSTNVDKPLQVPPLDDEYTGLGSFDVEVDGPEEENFEIDLDGPETEHARFPDQFDGELSAALRDSDLGSLGSDLLAAYDADEMSRSEWTETYREGIKQLGLKIEERSDPWPGAISVRSQLMPESIVRYQAQIIQEIFPAAGPVKTKIINKETRERLDQSLRVRRYMNYLLTERMREYRAETEKLLFGQALAGSAFRKAYFDPALKRPSAMYVPAENLCVDFNTSDLNTSERYTHLMTRSPNAIKRLQKFGFYRDVDLSPMPQMQNPVADAKSEQTGMAPAAHHDQVLNLCEMFVDWELEDDPLVPEDLVGLALPYVVTLDKDSGTVLSIRRNWKQQDPTCSRRQHFVHYPYIYGLGFYGYGMAHLIGGNAKGATAALQMLLDAGTLANIPGGFKSRDLRIMGGDKGVIKPGEWRDVETTGASLRENLVPLPYKEPSTVLYQLKKDLEEDGKRFASLADMKVGDMSSQAPVGTTLAILETQYKVMSAIQARTHAAQKEEFSILHDIIAEDPEPYPYEEDGDKAQDFNGEVAVIPVADPNAATMAMRIVQAQAVQQLAATAPHLYDLQQLHRDFLNAMQYPNVEKVLPMADEIAPADPVSENMAIMTGKPVKAHLYQDHQAHIAVHMAASQDPKIMGALQNSPNAQAIMASFSAHVVEHLAMAYRAQIEKEMGVQLPAPGEPLPEDVELQLSKLVAEAADQVLGRNVAQAQAEQIAQQLQDPVVQQQNRELGIKEEQAQQARRRDAARQELDTLKEQNRHSTETARVGIEAIRVAGELDGSAEERAIKESSGIVTQGTKMAERLIERQTILDKEAYRSRKPKAE